MELKTAVSNKKLNSNSQPPLTLPQRYLLNSPDVFLYYMDKAGQSCTEKSFISKIKLLLAKMCKH